MAASRVFPVLTSSSPMTRGISSRSPFICSRRTLRLSRSGEPGAYSRAGSLTAVGGRKIPEALTDRHSISVQVQPYEVPGWGVGELWLDDSMLVYHELPRAAPPPAAGTQQAPALLE